MAGFIITIESNNKYWYLAGTLLFLAGSIALAVAGFIVPDLGITWGITGIVAAVVSAVLVIDAFMNL